LAEPIGTGPPSEKSSTGPSKWISIGALPPVHLHSRCYASVNSAGPETELATGALGCATSMWIPHAPG
jgi:hypothetical protein